MKRKLLKESVIIRRFYLCFFVIGLLTRIAQADTSSELNSAQQNKANDINVSGYIDGSYNYLQNSNQFISGTNDRVFDLEENGFTLQQAAVTVADQPTTGFGALVNLMVGRDAFTTAAYGFNPDMGLGDIGFDATQAYLQYATGPLTIIGGKFVALAGAEVINPTADTNFSRSILDGYAEPFTFTGARATYSVNKNINLIAGVNNGWDSIKDANRRPTLELGVADTFNSFFSLALTGYTGEQRIADRTSSGLTGIRTLIDLVATLNATKKLSFVTNYDYGIQTEAALPNNITGQAVWLGIAEYMNYQFNNKWQTSVRGEYFADQKGYRTGVVQDWKELTLSLAYLPIKNLELRAETRRDFSNVDSFITTDRTTVKNNQQSYALEAFYKFD